MNIEPKTLKGFRDFLPEQQIARQKLIEIIKKTYESFGFVPLETPALEYSEILLGKYGEEGDKLMYRFLDNGQRDVAMRYDLTIPLARVIAQYPDIKKPFKRYQIAPVWRAENTQKGRFREFYQCDVDIVGTTSMLADGEIIALIFKTLNNLSINNFIIRVNNRKILNGFYESLGVDEKTQVNLLRIVDKVDKVGVNGISEELISIGISQKIIEEILRFMSLQISSLDDLQKLISKYGATCDEGADELSSALKYAMALGVDKKNYKVDLSIARGLDYYTGNVFETNLTDLPKFGSVFSGGRYDGLIGLFSKQSVPAIGASIGLDRLFAAMEELQLLKKNSSTASVMFANIDSLIIEENLSLTDKLRQAGINTIMYFESGSLGQQLKYAADLNIEHVIIRGEQEKKAGQIVIKEMNKNQQVTIEEDKLLEYFDHGTKN